MLNKISTARIFEKANTSIVPPVLSIVNTYTAISYIAVVIMTINVIINLLSLEKFLLNISPNSPIAPSTNADIPTFFPMVDSQREFLNKYDNGKYFKDIKKMEDCGGFF